MNELFAQIRAGDEHAAMVYADLVEQRGDVPRALLIRRQCQLAKLPAWSRAATEARWEVEYLITHFGATWRAELPSLPGVTWLEFDRGFVGSVRVAGASVLHEHAVELGAASPTLSRVVIRDLDEREAPLVHAIPWLRTLCLEAHDEIHLHATRSLIGVCAELEIERGTENTTRFIGTARFGRLERLAVRGEHTAGIPLARDIAANTALHELSVLELGTRFVDFNYGYYGRPTLREAGADVLAATALEYVEVLDVTRQYIGPAGLNSVMRAAPALRELAAGLCDLTNLDALHHDGAPIDRLELRANAIGIAGATAIATAARLRECKHLVLDTCELDGGSIDLLTTAPCWSSLRVLDLSRNALGNEATLALATAPPPKELHTLKLADIEVDREAMIAFATAPWLGQLLEVDLAKLPVPAALLEKLSGVKSLRLAGATFDMAFGMVEGLAAVCERAVVLDLDDTPAMPSFAPELQVLRLARGGFDVRLLSRLLGGGYPRLLELDLSGNAFDEEMVAVLVRNGLIRGLSRLVLKGVVLDGPSIELVAAQGLGPLDLLDLRDVHGYTAEHMLLFARSTALREIKRIAFHGSPWRFPRAAQDELVERFGVRWYDHDDEPDEFNDEDE